MTETNHSHCSSSQVESLAGLLSSAWDALNGGDARSAAGLFTAAVTQAEAQFKTNDDELIKTLIDSGSGLSLTGPENFSTAAQMLRRALDMRIAKNGESDVECGRLYRQISLIDKSAKNYPDAIGAVRKAIDIFEGLKSIGFQIDENETREWYRDLHALLNLQDAQENASQANSDDRDGTPHSCVVGEH